MPRDGLHVERQALTLRLAKNADGPAIAMLRAACGYRDADWLDWSDIEPHWIVACDVHDIVGALSVCPGKPFGRLEMLAVHPGLAPRRRAECVKALVLQGMATLRLYGAQIEAHLIPFGDEFASYKNILKKRGAVIVESGHIMYRRL